MHILFNDMSIYVAIFTSQECSVSTIEHKKNFRFNSVNTESTVRVDGQFLIYVII